MAARSTSRRRLHWLVLVGLVGAGAWVVRSRRASARWPEPWPAARVDHDGVNTAPIPAVPTPAGPIPPAPIPVAPIPPAPTPVRAASGSGAASGGPAADAPTPPLGIELPPVAPPPPPPVVSPAPEPDASTLTGQALFTPPDVDQLVAPAEPAAPPAAPAAPPVAPRPSPTPRPRPAATEPDPEPAPGAGSAPARSDGSSPGPEYTIKGNAGSKLFHRPDSPYYTRTKAEIWFRTATDARAAGFTEWKPRNRAGGRPAGDDRVR